MNARDIRSGYAIAKMKRKIRLNSTMSSTTYLQRRRISFMPIQNYGVLKARPQQAVQAIAGSPHYQILVVDGNGMKFRIAVNVESDVQPMNLQYYIDTDFQNAITSQLSTLASSFTALTSQPGGLALDYVRGGLFPLDQVDQLFAIAAEKPLSQLLNVQVQRAIADPDAFLCAFGQRWPESNIPDRPFGFVPDNGVHDIHMNQGDTDPSFAPENGSWQDGALLLYLPSTQKWTAIFLKFQSQSWQTDANGQPES
jgi:uncharacterized protein YukJ